MTESGGDGPDEHQHHAHQAGDHDRRRLQPGVEQHLRGGQPGAPAQLGHHRAGREQVGPVDQHLRLPGVAGDHRHGRVGVAQGLDGGLAALPGSDPDDLQPVRQRVRQLLGPGADHHRLHLVDVEAGRVAEHHQQQHREQDHHGQRAPVPAHLAELLHRHGPHAAGTSRHRIHQQMKSTTSEIL
jgi:hypothetical protein